jgi:hypothetical protein
LPRLEDFNEHDPAPSTLSEARGKTLLNQLPGYDLENAALARPHSAGPGGGGGAADSTTQNVGYGKSGQNQHVGPQNVYIKSI